MPICSIFGCKNNTHNTKNNGITFHSIPKDEKKRLIWLEVCQIMQQNDKAKKHICSVHFNESDFKRDFRGELMGEPSRRYLNSDGNLNN